MTDPNKPTTVVTRPTTGGQQVVTDVLPHGAKPVSVAEVAAADPQSANALLQATHMLDPLMGVVGGAANPAMAAMQSAIGHRGAEAAVEKPQDPTTLKEHGKMTFVDAPKQHVTAQFEAPPLVPQRPLAKTGSTGAGGAAKPTAEAAAIPKPKEGEVHPKQQAAPADDGGAGGAHNGSGQKRKHSEGAAPTAGADKDKGVVPTAAGDKAAPAPVDAAATHNPAGEEGESAAKSTPR